MCVYPFITLVSGSVYFGRAVSLGVSLAGRVIFSFCVGFCFVECRAGTLYLGVSLGWVAGLYGFFFSWLLLRWVRYDLNSVGYGPSFFGFFSLLSALSAGGRLW